ncbi:MAG: dTMP kinase [Ignavibacteriae bacterium HGW-Ignavibacteriae-4]|jgi:dTMP kinase|nr:MAG: dTMP kinase [Ignavibacteriae bacterium HGW-Ignavibacteriae-4]
MFITFEGIDGSGKSTQILLLREYLVKNGHKVVTLREPGGTELSEYIRAVLLNKKLEVSDISELLLFQAARADLVKTIVLPSLDQGRIVLSDRFFDSTTAYQGYGRGIDMEIIEKSNQIGSLGVLPDMTFYLNIERSVGIDRDKEKDRDRMELSGDEFYDRVIHGYDELAKNESRFITIDGNQDVKTIHALVVAEVEKLINK